ncbi:Secreted protein, containing von Willebrand factor (vWF) type A domain [Methylophaga frappieri]|uniref:Secreted protein, containing von Willebrand factor (VWF) type A domain n=1 Tax=Methylophaga frappieri (strain ATCC BAA-2434 / DSM 25690 / JAM7) TaxID=754477 RepID=I1YLA8_METFJ|nr:hypothetical protein [Methylophaga frappieri]AFJ03701.1 Secreted protein, containing von Willebrand factor (vWF) type A domain [Methylophaga frappieri]
MKSRKKTLDIFSLSFLDIISCGFGAVVMLILIAKPDTAISQAGQSNISEMLATLVGLKNTVTITQQQIESELASLEALSVEQAAARQAQADLQKQQQQLAAADAALTDNISGLSLVESRLRQAALTTPRQNTPEVRSEAVGGIPVDSDYVVFIIDTSGSMQRIWSRVSREVVNVLNIHPEVKGFQILNDLGTSMISGYDGKWMSDTPATRNNVIRMFDKWSVVSNSSPVEGIETALRKYAKPNITTSIYVFGDDYTGGSFDNVIARITQQNRVLSNGQRLARIHGVGFLSMSSTERYGILMRELTKQNGGTYLALPP